MQSTPCFKVLFAAGAALLGLASCGGSIPAAPGSHEAALPGADERDAAPGSASDVAADGGAHSGSTPSSGAPGSGAPGVEAAHPEPPADPKTDLLPRAKPEAKTELVTVDANAPREIKYTPSPEGLKIVVAGARFVARASAVRAGSGWGVKVDVSGQSTDDKPRSVLTPKRGPLMFAGLVTRRSKSSPDQFGDERDGDADVPLSRHAQTWSRDWPSKGSQPLAPGDALDLQVGLWALGEDKSDRRPVKQFFHVRMKVDKGKPRAIVEPPASARGG